MSKLTINVFIVLVVILCVGRDASAQDSCPATIEGIVRDGEFFGPPNYGEDPATDAIERAWYLQLPAPIETLWPHTLKAENCPKTNHTVFIQLIVIDDTLRKRVLDLQGERIRVVGDLEEAVTGHHHTQPVISVTAVEAISGWLDHGGAR